jgi:hypothetical protein
MQIYETVMGEESAESLSKACFNPDELNNKDLVVLDQLFNLWWLKAARHLLLTSYGELHPMENAEWIAGNFIRQITGTAHGRWWWEQRSNSPRMESLGERVIRENPYDCAEYMSAFKSLDGSRPTTRD